MKSVILVINAGSSSHKCKLFDAETLSKEPLWEGSLDWSIAEGQVDMHFKNGQDKAIDQLLPASTDNPLKTLINTINFPYDLKMIGHRVVHGGSIFKAPVLITQDVKESIQQLIPLAPLHNPANLKGIEAMESLFPQVPQYAAFDTSFHTTIPSYAAEYPIPEKWSNLGIRRYGFHGISHCYCAHQAASMLSKDLVNLNLITCHLGNGCSITAVQEGKSIDTSMGFTPLEGVMMGTRSGSIDPGILFFLIREHQLPPDEIEHDLNHNSGLKGISGTDGDMRNIMKGVNLEDEDCMLALDMFVYRIAKCIGSMIAALGSVDGIVFTAGIGENSPLVRAEVCRRLAHYGVIVDSGKNEGEGHGDRVVSVEDGQVKIMVIHTEEEWAIAKSITVKSVNATAGR